MARKTAIAALILLVLGGLGYGLIRIIPMVLFPEDVRVPSVEGLSKFEGQRALRAAGLGFKIEQEVFDNEVPEGFIISQEPLPGRTVKQNREILVRVSKGREEMEMPDVLGKPVREAKLALTQSGFVLGEEIEIFDPGAALNTVTEQFPGPGEIVVKGSAVNLVINKGRQEPAVVTLPDFRGEDFERVKQRLNELGLNLGNSWTEYSTVYRKGLVVEQNPRPGTEVEEGWKIDFVYSQGEAKPAEPPEPAAELREEVDWVHENLWKSKEVVINVPPGPEQEVVILVIDDFGAREVYREKHKGGSSVVRNVQGRGDNPKFQVYIGARQFHDQHF